jgi:RNA polymerase sigma-70 factor, ECF subfamily
MIAQPRQDYQAFEAVMRRHNGRLFRVARSILKNDADAEDALQDAYLEAYRHLNEFRAEAELSTWLTRIVVNQSLMRLRKQKRDGTVVPFQPEGVEALPEVEVRDDKTESPSTAVLRTEMRRILERRIDELPVAYRTVFVMREIEDMTVEETAQCLDIPSSTVRTRLFRARALLRASVSRDVDMATGDVFAFLGARCDRIVANVLARLPR